MRDDYNRLLEIISSTHNVSLEELERRVAARRARLYGLIGKRTAARTIAATMGFESFLAAGAHHVSGLQVSDALAAARHEARSGHLSSFAYWPNPNEPPAVIGSHYVQAIDAVAAANLDSSISIKVDQFHYDREILAQVLHQAMLRRIRVHFDAQPFETTDRTHALVEEAVAMGADVSATLPSRWERSVQDAERFLRLGIPIRIVKGQGKDPGQPGIDPRRSFLSLVRQVAGRAAHVGIATHDRRVAEPALDLLQATKTPCSLEQLRSLPRLDFLAQRRGIPIRVYIAYGRFGLPYAIAEVVRRPSILAWILRDAIVRGHRQVDDR